MRPPATPSETAATASRSGFAPDGARLRERRAGERERDVRARDGGAAGSGVGDEHVAVERERAVAEPRAVHDAAQGPPDEALDLQRPSRLLAARRFAGAPLERGPRQHPVFGRHPAEAGPLQERRDLLLDRGRHEDLRPALRHEAGSLRVRHGIADDRHGPEVERPAAVGARRTMRGGSHQSHGGILAQRTRRPLRQIHERQVRGRAAQESPRHAAQTLGRVGHEEARRPVGGLAPARPGRKGRLDGARRRLGGVHENRASGRAPAIVRARSG